MPQHCFLHLSVSQSVSHSSFEMFLACPRHTLTLPLAKCAGANDPWCYDKIIAAWWAFGNRMMFVNWPLCIPHSSLVRLRAHCHLFSLLLSLPLLFPLCYSRSKLLQPSFPSTPRSPLPTASCWEAWSTANIPSIILALLQCVKEEIGKGGKKRKEIKRQAEKGRGRREDTFVLLIPVLKDTITSHSILSMFYTSPRRHALPRRTRPV